MKKHLGTVILVIVLIIGSGLIIYPTASNYWNSLHQSKAIADYIKSVSDINETRRKALLEVALDYNKKISKNGLNFSIRGDAIKDYESLLSIDDTGIMGYLDIDIIGCHLPIYHGVESSVLQIAIGHIPGSSMPIGGESTHCILSGHRGLPSAKIFSNLDRLGIGDTFIIHTLNDTLTYEVDNITTVVPDDVSSLKIVPGADLCTLVTCTPYGVNTHRLLVRGHRVENSSSVTVRVNSEALILSHSMSAVLFLLPLALISIVILFITADIKAKRAAARKKLGIAKLSEAYL